MTVLLYDRVRITLRDTTGEWTYEQGPWRKHAMMTKEKLRREVSDWIKRSQHEAKLAFAEGDLWAAIAWGAKVPSLLAVERDMRAIGYETGIGVDCLYERIERIVRSIDWSGNIRAMLPSTVSYVMGIDMAEGSGHALATVFAIEMDRLGRQTTKLLDSVTIKSPTTYELSDERLRERCRSRLGGKSADLFIIDDPLKK